MTLGHIVTAPLVAEKPNFHELQTRLNPEHTKTDVGGAFPATFLFSLFAVSSFLILDSPSSRHALQFILHQPRFAASISQFLLQFP